MKRNNKLILILIITATSCTKSIEIPYPEPRPDTTALRFMPGLVSIEGTDFNAAFSPDGKSCYFTRSKNRKWDIYVSHHDGKEWSEPVVAPFCSERYSEADPAFSPDGKLYFISDYREPKDSARTDFDIWFTEPMEDGQWSAFQNVSIINSDSTEYYVSFAKNGNLYFASARAGGFGDHDVYVSRLVDGAYTLPENLGPNINTAQSDHDPCPSPNEDFLVFKSENRPDGFGEADLYCSVATSGGWSPAVNLGSTFNTPTYEYCAYLSPDERYFFYSSEQDVKWIDAEFLKRKITELCKAP